MDSIAHVMKIYYPQRATTHHAVLAERTPDGSWTVAGFATGPRTLSAEEFAETYTEHGPAEYSYYWTSYRREPSPNALVDAGTHTLEAISTKAEMDAFWDANPDAYLYEPAQGRIFQKKDMPVEWQGFLREGADLVSEANELYRLPYIAAKRA